MEQAWNNLEKNGFDVMRHPVAVRDRTGQLRIYDGAVVNPDGTLTGIEVKSGTATLTKAQ